LISDFTSLSNSLICEGGVADNVGYYFKLTFPVFDANTVFEFDIPVNAGNGGLVMFDGAIVAQTPGVSPQPTKALSFQVNLTDGNHKMEVYAASQCCDDTTYWLFQVNETSSFNSLGWQQVTSSDLNYYMTTHYDPNDYIPPEPVDPCEGLDGFEAYCPGLSGWHYEEKADEGMVDVCALLVQTNGGSCKDYCES